MSFAKLLSADAAEFIPSPLVIPALPMAPLTFSVYRASGAPSKRTFDLIATREPRTKSLHDGPLSMIGLQVRGYEHPFNSAVPDDKHIVYGCHDNDYRLESIVRPMPSVATAPLGDFPKNIQDYFWVNDGKNDEHPWYLLARLSNGTYVFLEASCTFSGFNCQGQIHLYAADSMQALYDHAMGEGARYRFACCFDKGTREKQAADKAARQAAYKAQKVARAAVNAARAAEYAAQKAARDTARRQKVQQVPVHLRQMQQARMVQAQQTLQAQVKTAPAASFNVLEERLERWQAMSDSDHDREEERMEAFRDRMREGR